MDLACSTQTGSPVHVLQFDKINDVAMCNWSIHEHDEGRFP